MPPASSPRSRPAMRVDPDAPLSRPRVGPASPRSASGWGGAHPLRARDPRAPASRARPGAGSGCRWVRPPARGDPRSGRGSAAGARAASAAGAGPLAGLDPGGQRRGRPAPRDLRAGGPARVRPPHHRRRCRHRRVRLPLGPHPRGGPHHRPGSRCGTAARARTPPVGCRHRGRCGAARRRGGARHPRRRRLGPRLGPRAAVHHRGRRHRRLVQPRRRPALALARLRRRAATAGCGWRWERD